MWKMMTLSFLMCFFIATQISVQDAADAAACVACTNAYKPAGDTDCTSLKKYLNCLEDAVGTTDWCTLPPDDVNKVKTAATCNQVLAPSCTCQKDFWGSDRTGDKECAALNTYIGCLKTAVTQPTCATGKTASELLTKAQGRSDSKCSTTTSKPTGGTTPTQADKKGTTTTPTGQKDSGASSLRMYSAIASFLPFVLTAFRL